MAAALKSKVESRLKNIGIGIEVVGNTVPPLQISDGTVEQSVKKVAKKRGRPSSGLNWGSRNFCCTTYEIFDIREFKMPEDMRYCILCNETCPTTGKPHIHAYIEMNASVKASRIKSIFDDNTMHIEKREAETREPAIDYVKKDDEVKKTPKIPGVDYVEYGKLIGQGHRSDLDDVAEQIKAGESLREIAESSMTTFIKYSRGIKEAKILHDTKFDIGKLGVRKMSVEIYWGASGTGKTTRALKGYEVGNVFKMSLPTEGTPWFDGYVGQDVLVIDEFVGNVPITQLLQWTDNKPLRIPVKGGFADANWSVVRITSNKPPNAWYNNICQEHKDGLIRRVEWVYRFDKDAETGKITIHKTHNAKFKPLDPGLVEEVEEPETALKL